ncbi:MAG: FG-GAP-like repeat-containing protein [Planctomycetota bacterium]
MLKSRKNCQRSFFATIETMERREVMTAAPVLMTDGGLASQPTWGKLPTSPLDSSISTLFEAATVITSDAAGNPIDFNKDGYPDLLETGLANGLVGYGTKNSSLITSSRGIFGKVAFGGPNGPIFSTKGRVAIGSVPFQASGEGYAVVDLNGDGFQDILTTRNVNNTIPGSGFITEKWLYDPQQQVFVDSPNSTVINGWAGKTGALTLGDVNSDGLTDLVSANFGTTPVPVPNSYYLAFPMLGFQVFAGVADPSTGQWAGDFTPDAITTITLKQQNVEWGLPANGNSPNYSVISAFGSIAVVNTVLADFNADGKLDLATPEADGITTYPNPGNGQFSTGVFTASAGAANGLNLVAADLNNDGKMDLATSPNYVSLWLKRETSPSFSDWTASQAPLSAFLNTTPAGGAIGFSVNPVNAFDAESGWNGALAVADFNGDGNKDLAVGSGSNEATLYGILAGDGTGKFGTQKHYIAYSNAADGFDDTFQRAINGLAVSDFNRDGQIDVVTTAINIGPVGSSVSVGNKANPAVGITGIGYNKSFAASGVNPQAITAYVGQPFAQTIQPTGGDPSKIYLFSLNPNSVALPPGMTLSPTGQLTGTPTVSGPFQLTINITQPNGPRSTAYLYLTVNSPTQSTTLPGIMPNAVAGVPFQQQLTSTSGPATWVVTGGALPTGLSLSQNGLITGTPLALGTYNFTVLGTGSGFQSVMNYQMLIQSVAAPVVTKLVRYGYHAQPTTLVASFSQSLDASAASNVGNYVLTSAGADGRFGTRDDKNVPLASAIYNAGANTVTLGLVQKNIPLRQLYRLAITGTPTSGLQNTGGTFLGGQGIGAPGTNYVQIFNGKILAGPNLLLKNSKVKSGK